MENQYGAYKRPCQMGAGTAAHADMRGTVRPLGGSQVTPRSPPWLFPAPGREHKPMTTATKPMHRSSVQGAFRTAQQRAGIMQRDVGMHTLRKVCTGWFRDACLAH